MDEEMRFHLEARAADLAGTGLDEKEAMRKARLEFGPIATHKDAMRRSLGLRWWDELWGDVRYALRILRKSPGFAAIAICSLALAIGANTTIFSVANELLYARLGVPHPEQLRLLTATIGDEDHSVVHDSWGGYDRHPDGSIRIEVFTYPIYQYLRQQNQLMQDIFAFKDLGHVNATVDGSAASLQLELVSGNFYQQMQVKPQLGRLILPSDDQTPGAGAVVVISDGYWAREFSRSKSVLGKVITVNMLPVTIVGVNPASFTGAESVQTSPELFMPLSMIPLLVPPDGPGGPMLANTREWWVEVMGRIKPGASDQQAQAALAASLNAAVLSTMTVGKGEHSPRLNLEDGSKGLDPYGRQFAQPLHVLLVMVGCVLLLACANMANLMLARASAREREMSVRLALGAGRWRILRQVITESLLLSAIGGAFGLLLGYLGRTAMPKLLASAWERSDLHVPFDWKIFAFTAAITISTGILFGLAPAWASTKADMGTALKKGSRTSTRRRHGWSGRAIVGFQVALSTLLLVGAVLFLRTLLNLNAVDPGFRTDHLLLFSVNPPSQQYPPPQDVALHARLEEALRAVPGVQDVTLTTVPLLGNGTASSSFLLPSVHQATSRAVRDRSSADRAYTGADFFKVMGIPLIAGRNFTQQDADAGRPVAIVNEALAQKFFGNQNPVGRRFTMNGSDTDKDTHWTEIIGVCANTRYNNLRNVPPPIHFDLYNQYPEIGGATYIVRTQSKPEAIVPSLRAAVQRIDRDLPLMGIRTQQEQIDSLTQQERMFAALTSGFGLLALALACVGIYGIMAYTVAQRTNEIGIRLALGAERRQVRGIVLREAGWLAIIGVACGLAVALALGKLVQSMLYGLQPADPTSLAAAGILLLAVALASGWVPAARASSVEPMEALRHE
jgi:predicted permease